MRLYNFKEELVDGRVCLLELDDKYSIPHLFKSTHIKGARVITTEISQLCRVLTCICFYNKIVIDKIPL